MYTAVVIGGIVLIVAMVLLSYRFVWLSGRDTGYEQGRDDQRAANTPARAPSPRHAAAEPRRRPERTALVRDGDPSPRPAPRPAERQPEPIVWEREAGPVELPGRAYADWMMQRMAAAKVVLPEPGAYRPQAGRDSSPGTITFPATGPIGIPPKISEELSTTGAIAAIIADTDARIAARAIEEETFRSELTT